MQADRQGIVLFVVSILNYHREVEPVIAYFRKRGYATHVLIGWVGADADRAIEHYLSLGCQIHRVPDSHAYGVLPAAPGAAGATGPETANTVRRTPKKRLAQSVRDIPILGHYLGRLAGLIRATAAAHRTRQYARDLVRTISPNLIFMGPFHSCGRFDNAIMVEASTQQIARCCYPVSTYHGKIGAHHARQSNLRRGMLPQTLRTDYDILNRLLAFLRPSWTFDNGTARTFMWDPLHMIAARLNGLLPSDIWQKPSPDFDRVYVFSEFSASLLEHSGFPMDRVETTGIPLLDDVFHGCRDRSVRERIFKELRLQADEPFLLFNVEPSFEHHYCDATTHWARFDSMMTLVSSFQLPVVLSLHPLCDEADYAYAEQRFGVRIARHRKIYELYPYCRLAVSFACSTNILAEIFDKPIVVYDFFGMADEASERAFEFRLPFVKVANTFEQIRQLIAKELDKSAHCAEPPSAGAGLACTLMFESACKIANARQVTATSRPI